MTKALMVVSGADALVLADGTSHPTGFWAEEVVESLRVLREAGVEVAVATPGGVRPTVDAASLEGNDFGAAVDAIADELASPLVLADVDAADFDAVYLPGGHGPMADLAVDGALGRLLVRFEAEGKVVAALCHGPAGLLSAVREDGAFAFAGRELTVFTDEEERQGGLDVPYSVEARLRDLGARVAAGPAWSSTVVVDGNLVTGQNPQSSVDTARQVAGLLARRG
ncbi:type 1 glutamine amidotransferase domain-containing protein [Umezawaea sp.]|uniref:type 1 glutamine amidotransferase domain-containing protein n=1 Tax=Umezawaea sp. TaxID=1955258 RepID=UPI002ED2F907